MRIQGDPNDADNRQYFRGFQKQTQLLNVDFKRQLLMIGKVILFERCD